MTEDLMKVLNYETVADPNVSFKEDLKKHPLVVNDLEIYKSDNFPGYEIWAQFLSKMYNHECQIVFNFNLYSCKFGGDKNERNY